MTGTAPELFALARRGLPLPIATHSPLRAAWLPSVVRNRPVPAFDTPPPSEPRATRSTADGDEPWWVEAAEWVPPDEVNAPADQGAVTTATPPRPMDDTPGDGSQTESPYPVHKLPVIRAQTATASSEPIARGAMTTGERSPAPDASRSNPGRSPSVSVAQTAIAKNEFTLVQRRPASPFVASTATEPTRPVTAGTENLPDEADQNPPTSVPARQAMAAAPVLQPEKRATQSHPNLTAASAVEDSVAATRPANALASSPTAQTTPVQIGQTTPVQIAQTTRSFAVAREPMAGASVRLNPDSVPQAAARLQTMGIPRSVVEHSALAHVNPPRVDMSSFLAPPPRRERQVQIDRISVTVQAPPSAPAQAVAHAATRATAPAAPANVVYRNPWSGYHARRD